MALQVEVEGVLAMETDYCIEVSDTFLGWCHKAHHDNRLKYMPKIKIEEEGWEALRKWEREEVGEKPTTYTVAKISLNRVSDQTRFMRTVFKIAHGHKDTKRYLFYVKELFLSIAQKPPAEDADAYWEDSGVEKDW